MNQPDLDRVAADLAAMKQACSQPVLPREEIGASLLGAAGCASLAAAVWFVPGWWIKLGTLAAGGSRSWWFEITLQAA